MSVANKNRRAVYTSGRSSNAAITPASLEEEDPTREVVLVDENGEVVLVAVHLPDQGKEIDGDGGADFEHWDVLWRNSAHRGPEPEPELDRENFMRTHTVHSDVQPLRPDGPPPTSRMAPQDSDIVERERTFDELLELVDTCGAATDPCHRCDGLNRAKCGETSGCDWEGGAAKWCKASPVSPAEAGGTVPTAALERLGNVFGREQADKDAAELVKAKQAAAEYGNFSCNRKRALQKAVIKARQDAKAAKLAWREARVKHKRKHLRSVADSLEVKYNSLKRLHDLC